MQIDTVCNTPDDVLFAHIEENSARPLPWVRSVPAHDGHAVIVGGGPSVSDWIEEIRWRKTQGQTIFALNNAAKYLSEHGIEVDHQVIVDARESNAAFIGYAKHYLLSSQCHPSLFDKAGAVTLWHQEYPQDMERFDACLPGEHPAHALIGGGTTVGLSAMVLAYALGFRLLHLYGYDSSYREGTHAYAQTDPQRVDCTSTVAGKTFRTSLAMARQAELFPQLSDSLLDLGCTITLRGDGLLPWVSQQSAQPKTGVMTEAEKYARMWEFERYRLHSPGEHIAELFVMVSRIGDADTCIDFGCGTGRGGHRIVEMSGCDMTLVDFAANSIEEPLTPRFRFVEADLSQPMGLRAKFGFCADVMEHIPPEQVDDVLANVTACVDHAFFNISLIPDACGAWIGQVLHLSVHPFEWWADKLRSYGEILFMEDHGDSAVFYLTTQKVNDARQ